MKTKTIICEIKTLACIAAIFFLVPAAMATPYDGLYFTQYSDEFDKIAADYDRSKISGFRSDMLVPEYSRANVFLQERDDGTIILLKLDLARNHWQAYIGYAEGSEYKFTNVFNQINYEFFAENGVQITAEEITISFGERGAGTYTHTIIVNSNPSVVATIPLPEDGRVELMLDEPLYRMGSGAVIYHN